jgi:hypothetical protein
MFTPGLYAVGIESNFSRCPSVFAEGAVAERVSR